MPSSTSPSRRRATPRPRWSRRWKKNGIGRPSTYATISTTIQARDYVCAAGKQLAPTDLGLRRERPARGQLPALHRRRASPRTCEGRARRHRDRRAEWQPVLHEFYDPFKGAVAAGGMETIPQVGARNRVRPARSARIAAARWPTRMGRFGKFIGCTNFPKCQHVEPIAMVGVLCPL